LDTPFAAGQTPGARGPRPAPFRGRPRSRASTDPSPRTRLSRMSRTCACRKECGCRDSPQVARLDASDVVALAPCGLELLAQVIGRLALVGDQLLDPVPHAVFDPSNLSPDLLDICVLASIALALAPQPSVFAAQVGDGPPDPTVDAQPVAGLRAWDLLAAVPAKNEDGAHERLTSPPCGEVGF